MRAIRTVSCGSALLLALGLSVSSAPADMIQFEGFGRYLYVYVHSPDLSANTPLGELLVRYEGTDYVGYCVDLYQHAGSGEYSPLPITSLHNGELVAWLFEQHAEKVQTDTQAAALQTAILEVLYELDNTAFDANSGQFRITGNDSVASLANQWLSEMPASYSPTYDLMVLHSPELQDTLVGSHDPVPEPAAASLMGLCGLAMVIRNRRRS